MSEQNKMPRKITGMASPQLMVMSGNLAQQWEKWVQSFKFYLRASGLEEESDGRKVALLLHGIGEKGVDVFNTFDKDEDQIKYDELIKLFQNHFAPKANLTYECHNFFTYKQGESESLEDFARSLILKSQSCELGVLQERLIKVMFICNIHQKYNYIKDKLLLEDELNLDEALEMAKGMLASRHRAEEWAAEQSSVLYNTSLEPHSRSKCNLRNVTQYSQEARPEVCTKCGQVHLYKCPAIGVKGEKEEPEWGECGVSEAAAAEGLYAEHEIKDELVIGPELMQTQDIAFTIDNQLSLNEKDLPDQTRPEAGGADAPTGCSPTCPGDCPRCNRSTEQQHRLRSGFTRLEGLKEEDLNISTPFCVSSDCELRREDNCQPQLDHNLAPSHTDLLVERNMNEKPLSCNICCKEFSEQIELNSHVLTHTAEDVYCCDVCSKQFTDKRMLTRHIRKHFEKRYSCNICNKSFMEMSMLTQHARLHTDKRPYGCDMCYKSFKFRTTLIYHKLIHNEKPTCDVCNRQFETIGNLNSHKLRHTRVQPSCDVCNKQFASSSQLANHKLTHADEKLNYCEVCKKLLSTEEALAAHTQMHTDELTINKENPLEPKADGADVPSGCSHACPGEGPRCNRSTEQQHGLRTYLVRLKRLPVGNLHNSTPFRATHLVKKQYSCDIKTNLSRHELIRTGEKTFNCVVCHKHFEKKSILPDHLGVHTGEKPFRCDVCGRQFRDRTCIIRHLRCHTGEKPYMCDVCKKSFRFRTSLVIHKHTGEKPYNCDVCNKPFSERGQLKRHLRVHTGEKPFTCDVCGQRFARRTALVVHSRYHESKNLYIWDGCEEKFIKKSTLTKHVQSPVGKNLYSCDVCNKRFITEMFLTRHKTIHTSVL